MAFWQFQRTCSVSKFPAPVETFPTLEQVMISQVKLGLICNYTTYSKVNILPGTKCIRFVMWTWTEAAWCRRLIQWLSLAWASWPCSLPANLARSELQGSHVQAKVFKALKKNWPESKLVLYYINLYDVGSGLRPCADQCPRNAASDPRCPGQAYRSGNLKKTDYWFG